MQLGFYWDCVSNGYCKGVTEKGTSRVISDNTKGVPMESARKHLWLTSFYFHVWLAPDVLCHFQINSSLLTSLWRFVDEQQLLGWTSFDENSSCPSTMAT